MAYNYVSNGWIRRDLPALYKYVSSCNYLPFYPCHWRAPPVYKVLPYIYSHEISLDRRLQKTHSGGREHLPRLLAKIWPNDKPVTSIEKEIDLCSRQALPLPLLFRLQRWGDRESKHRMSVSAPRSAQADQAGSTAAQSLSPLPPPHLPFLPLLPQVCTCKNDQPADNDAE